MSGLIKGQGKGDLSLSHAVNLLQCLKEEITYLYALNKDEEDELEASIEKALLNNNITFVETQDKI